MKKQVFVLEKYSNGHTAANKLVRAQGWKRGEYVFIFCGSHTEVIEKLKTTESYAILPTYNSIAGDVTEVIKPLEKLKKALLSRGRDRFAQNDLNAKGATGNISLLFHKAKFNFYIFNLFWGRVVAQVRNIFEKIDDATIYIPSFKDSYPTPALTISK